MRLKALRLALLGAAVLGVLIAAFMSTLYWLASSERGTALLVDALGRRTAPALTIGTTSGTLLDGLTLNGVEVLLERDELEIERLRVVWNVAAVLAGRLELDEVDATTVRYRRLPSAEASAERARRIEMPFPIRVVNGRVHEIMLEAREDRLFFGETRFAAELAGDRLTLDTVETHTSDLDLAGRATITLAEPLALDVEIAWSRPGQDWAGALALAGDWPMLELHHELSAPFTSTARGELDLSGPPRVDLTVEWQDLAIPDVAVAASPSGRLDLVGAVDAYEFKSVAQLIVAGEPVEFATEGTGSAALLSFDSLAVETAYGEVHAAGQLAFDTLEWDLAIAANDLDPSLLFEEWPARLTAHGRLRGALTPELLWSFDGLEIAGELRGYPIAAEGRLEFDHASGLRLDTVRIASGANVVDVDGYVNEEWAVEVRARLDELALLEPRLSGAAIADVTLGGPLRTPEVAGSVEARALALDRYSAERLSVAGRLRLADEGDVQLAVTGAGVARGRAAADTLDARIEGTLARHRVSLAAQADEWVLESSARGMLDGTLWDGSIERLSLDRRALGAWRLANPTALHVGRASVTLESTCLAQSGAAGRVCLAFSLEGKPEDALRLSAERFDLQTLQPLLPEGFSLTGTYDLSASLSDLSGTPHGALTIEGGLTRARADLGEQDSFETEIERFSLNAALADWGIDLTAEVDGRETGRANLRARVQDVRRDDSRVTGALNVLWPDLGFLAVLSPDIGDVGGTLSIDLGLGGTVENPEVDGRAQLDEGRLAVPAWGLVVDGITADATSADGANLDFLATGRIGDGALELRGTTKLDPRAGWPTRLTVTGESVEAVQLPNAEIFVSPDLAVVATLPRIDVRGTVHVPRARIELSELPEQAVAPSADTVLHGVEAQTELRPLQMHADITMTLGENIEYSGLNLTTKVTGRMRLVRDSGRPTTASGSLRLAGTYNAYGQTLQLDRGQLLFTGPLDNPALDVRAVRTIEEKTVGVELTGTVRAPQTRIYSNPAMSEADALAYLLFGRPVTGTGSEETATLQTAAVSMGLQQALPVVQRIGQTLGLDELTVGATEDDTGALSAGKYLSPKVYIRYSYGLFNRIGGLLLRFRVNERLSVETRSGEQKSMDLLYTVEKD